MEELLSAREYHHIIEKNKIDRECVFDEELWDDICKKIKEAVKKEKYSITIPKLVNRPIKEMLISREFRITYENRGVVIDWADFSFNRS